jgi:hypothetical protein
MSGRDVPKPVDRPGAGAGAVFEFRSFFASRVASTVTTGTRKFDRRARGAKKSRLQAAVN